MRLCVRLLRDRGSSVTLQERQSMPIRAEITGRKLGTTLPKLTALELERHISVAQAAEFKNISEDTFKRRFAHLIRKQGLRRSTVKIRDLIEDDERAA
jgi:hypothetical protein